MASANQFLRDVRKIEKDGEKAHKRAEKKKKKERERIEGKERDEAARERAREAMEQKKIEDANHQAAVHRRLELQDAESPEEKRKRRQDALDEGERYRDTHHWDRYGRSGREEERAVSPSVPGRRRRRRRGNEAGRGDLEDSVDERMGGEEGTGARLPRSGHRLQHDEVREMRQGPSTESPSRSERFREVKNPYGGRT